MPFVLLQQSPESVTRTRNVGDQHVIPAARPAAQRKVCTSVAEVRRAASEMP